MSPTHARCSGLVLAFATISLFVYGCRMYEVASFADQKAALEEITPLGTPREEVAQRLKEAGIAYSTPSNSPHPGVFYCETWEMKSGERFQMYSELLFDEEGRLQDIRETPNNFGQ